MKKQWLRAVGGEVVNMHLILFIEPAAHETSDGKFAGRVLAVAPDGKLFRIFFDTFETLPNAEEAVERFILGLNLDSHG